MKPKRMLLTKEYAVITNGRTREKVKINGKDTYGQLYKKILDKHEPKQATESRDFNWSYQDMRWRANLYHSITGWNIALKALPTHLPTLKELGFNRHSEVVEMIGGRGLFLFIGPTDAGKSTTLAAAVEYLAGKGELGMGTSIEEPVEYLYPPDFMISQREIGADAESFQLGIREAVRQSMDTIIVGEIRDRETAHAAVNAGMTGHRVFATLHGDSIINGISRLFTLLDNEHDEVLPEALSGVVAQHLIYLDNDRCELIYETLLVDRPVKLILARGAREVRTVGIEQHRQKRFNLIEHTKNLIAQQRLPRDFLENWNLAAVDEAR